MAEELNPKVSVCMITYKHEEYIEQAIEGVLSQITNFPIELVIGEDASPDTTASKIQQFCDSDSVKIRARFNVDNLGMINNFVRTLSECKGEYIALLEGDDLWTDTNKLQRQVDFLEANREFSMCYHPVTVMRNDKVEADTLTLDVPDVSDIKVLARGNFMHTCSVVFRARLFDEFPSSYFSSSVGDYFLHMLNARYGFIKRLPQIMGTYRVHDGGVWSSQVGIDLKILNYLEAMIGCFDSEIDQLLKERHSVVAYKSFYNRINEDGFEARLQRCLKYGDETFSNEIKNLVKWEKASRGSLIIKNIRKIFY